MRKPSRIFLLLTLGSITFPLLAGCGQQGTNSTMSKDEASHFQGGPMPPDVQKEMAAKMQASDQKRAAAAAQPPAATGKP